MRALIPLVLALIAGATAARADTALLIANGRYDAAQNLREADAITRLEGPLSAAGFEVIVVENGPAEALRAAVSALVEAEERGRVLIAAAGHLVRSERGTWLLGTDAEAPDLGSVGAAGVALDVLFEVAGRAPGQAVLLLGTEDRRIEPGPGLAVGVAPMDPPQGVLVVSGTPDGVADFARQVLLRPGADLAAALAGTRGLDHRGFVSSALPFLPMTEAGPSAPPAASAEERALWQAVRELDTPGAYLAYLDRYPDGIHAAEAAARLAALESTDAEAATGPEAAEAALGLGREARRQIQRDLSLLGHDTRGVDGIFGPGTRSAIRRWQASRGFEATGFLTGPQIATLAEAARLHREAAERADRAFWQATGQGRDEAALRAYLARYPQGLFAEVARARLAEIEADRQAEAEAEERAVWQAVRAEDSVAAYRRYLALYPEGLFAAEARRRLSVLETGLTPEAQAQAEARETALGLTAQMRVLVERRLAALGFEPGPVDGRFDARTRQAIRSYQRSREVTATGYLDQITVVRLLAEAIGGPLFD